MIDNKLEVSLYDILDLINSAEDYGFYDDVLMSTFAEWIGGKLSDEDIEEYAQTYLTEEAKSEGYSKDDYEYAIDKLKEFRLEFCKNGKD